MCVCCVSIPSWDGPPWPSVETGSLSLLSVWSKSTVKWIGFYIYTSLRFFFSFFLYCSMSTPRSSSLLFFFPSCVSSILSAFISYILNLDTLLCRAGPQQLIYPCWRASRAWSQSEDELPCPGLLQYRTDRHTVLYYQHKLQMTRPEITRRALKFNAFQYYKDGDLLASLCCFRS